MFGSDFLSLVSIIILYLNQHPELPKRELNYSAERLLHGRPKVFAHRGGASENFENSMSAFRQADELGVDGIEIDVRKTKDGQYVVVHDENLLRVTGQDVLVSDIDYADIKPYLNRIVNDYGGEAYVGDNVNGEKPPLLEDVLDFVAHTNLLVSIDINLTDLKDNIIILDIARDKNLIKRIIVNSPADEEEIRKEFGPELSIAKGASELPEIYIAYFNGSLAENRFEADVFNTTFNFRTLRESPYYNLPVFPEFTLGDLLQLLESRWKSVAILNKVLQKRGVPVTYYLANFEEDYEQALKLGANAIMTDKPADLIAFLRLRDSEEREDKRRRGGRRGDDESSAEDANDNDDATDDY